MTFPNEVKQEIGYALGEAQAGRKADTAKPMSGLGPGVLEIVADHVGNTFRAVYAVKLGRDLFVLHVVQKKSKTGTKTPQPDIDLIKDRLKRVKAELRKAT